MRIRTVKPEFFTHEGLYEAEEETGLPLRVAFIGLWCAADREGRFKWQPRRLGVQILPYDQVDFSRVLHALTTRGFVVNYASNDGEFGAIPTFTDHQVINNREKESELPEPPKINGSDACPTRAPRVPHAGKAEGKGREGKGKEGITPLIPQGGMVRQELCEVVPKNIKRIPARERKLRRVNKNSPTMIRIGKWLGRKESTLWTLDEAYCLGMIDPPLEDIELIERYYFAQIGEGDYRRRGIDTILNNWNTERDRARVWKEEAKC